MRLNKYMIVPLAISLGISMTGCKDKKVTEEPVIETEETTEREEKNTIAVVGQVNLRDNTKETKEVAEESSSIIEETSEVEPVEINLRESTDSETIKQEEPEDKEEPKDKEETETESKKDKELKITGEQYQNFSVDMSNLDQYKYVGYDGDSTVFLDIDDNNETTSMLVFIYRDNSYIADKFGGLDDLSEDQKHEIGIELVKELTGIDVDITTADFRDRESESGAKYIGFRFGDSGRNKSGYVAFRLKKNKLECIMDTIDSTDPDGAKKVKDDVIEAVKTINFNGEECESKYDIAFTNINDGIQKMKNGE